MSIAREFGLLVLEKSPTRTLNLFRSRCGVVGNLQILLDPLTPPSRTTDASLRAEQRPLALR
jgi:hypothetical protein